MPWMLELGKEFAEDSLLATLAVKLEALGLASAEQVVEFFGDEVEEILQELYPEAELDEELLVSVRDGLRRLGSTARLEKRRRYGGLDPRLSDIVHCMETEKGEVFMGVEEQAVGVPGLSLDFLRSKCTWSTMGGGSEDCGEGQPRLRQVGGPRVGPVRGGRRALLA